MSRARSRLLLLGLWLLAGCAARPARLVRLYDVPNQALARYGFGGPPAFTTPAGPVLVKVYLPRALVTDAMIAAYKLSAEDLAGVETDAAQASAQARADLASQQATAAKGHSESEKAQAGVLGQDAAAATTDGADKSALQQATDRAATRQADDKAKAAATSDRAASAQDDARARTAQHQDTAATAADTARASTDRSAVRAPVRARGDASQLLAMLGRSRAEGEAAAFRFAAEEHRARSDAAMGCARGEAGASAATQNSVPRQPVLVKRSTKARVLIGERFEYVLELSNPCGVALQNVAFEDELDERLDVELAGVRASSGGAAKAALDGRRLSVTLSAAVPRGGSVRVYIPVAAKLRG